MKNIEIIQQGVFSFFTVFFDVSIAMLSGYPQKACNQPLEIKNIMINNSLLGFLNEEQFQNNDKESIIINQIMNIIREIDLLDIEMSNWVIDKTGFSTQDLITQCKQNIHYGKIISMITDEPTFPNWLKVSDFQVYIEKMSKKIEAIIDLIEIFEERANNVRIHTLNRAITLSRDWKLKQEIKILKCVTQKGIQKALKENIAEIINEKNPYEWMYEGFNQTIDDLIDKSQTTEPQYSIKILKSAFKHKPKSVQSCTLYYELANNFEKLEKWDEAIESYSQMLSVAPPNGVGLMKRAEIFIKQNRYSEAKKDLEDALKQPNTHLYILNEDDKDKIRMLLITLENKSS